MNPLLVDIYTFGYIRSGIPADPTENNGGFVFDCRFLSNPGAEARFSFLCGLDASVRDFLDRLPETAEFLAHVSAILDRAIASYRERGYTHLHVAFGCTGGQHRSVYCAERIAERLRAAGVDVRVTHTEKRYWS